ncbi:hypothetical protein [Nautilia sp.]
MKKIFSVLLLFVFVSASDSTGLNDKISQLRAALQQLEKRVDSQEKRIRKLEKALNIQQKEIVKSSEKVKKEIAAKLAVKNCNNIKITSLKYTYHNEVLPYYDLSVTFKNGYPKKIVFLEGDLVAEDGDGVKILNDFVKRKISIPSGKSVTVEKTHQLNSDLEKYLKDEKPENLKIYFDLIRAEFADGTVLECN